MLRWVSGGWLLLMPVLVLAGTVHRHGEGTLQLVIEEGTVEVMLVIPAQDVIGFEHAPRDAQQQQQVASALARLAEESILAWPDQAACERTDVQVANPFEQQHGAHPDITVRYRFQCAEPNALRYLDVLLLQD